MAVSYAPKPDGTTPLVLLSEEVAETCRVGGETYVSIRQFEAQIISTFLGNPPPKKKIERKCYSLYELTEN